MNGPSDGMCYYVYRTKKMTHEFSSIDAKYNIGDTIVYYGELVTETEDGDLYLNAIGATDDVYIVYKKLSGTPLKFYYCDKIFDKFKGIVVNENEENSDNV